jgi:predicted patatin/cPLA2 family phospholipase
MRLLLGDGGGQLGTYLWGVITEFLRLGMPTDYFDVHLSTSASAFNSAFLLSGQLEEGTRVWTQHLPSGFWKWNRNDMRYLEKVLREVECLNCGVFPEKKTQVHIAYSNPRTLRSEIKLLNTATDPIRMLLAAADMPFFTGRFPVDGQNYHDGGLISQPPLDHAQKFGPTETWVLMTSPRGHRLSSLAWNLISKFAIHDGQIRKLLVNCPERRNEILVEIESRSDLKVIRPLAPLPIGWRSCNKAAILQTFNLGIQSAQQFARENHW